MNNCIPKIKDIIENFEKYREVLIYKGFENFIPRIEEEIKNYERLRELNKLIRQKKTELNKINKEYIQSKDNSLLERAKKIREEINSLEEKIKILEEKISKVELLLPNRISKEVPPKSWEESEKPIKYVGKPKVYKENIETFTKLYTNVEFEEISYKPLHHYNLVGKYIDQ